MVFGPNQPDQTPDGRPKTPGRCQSPLNSRPSMRHRLSTAKSGSTKLCSSRGKYCTERCVPSTQSGRHVPSLNPARLAITTTTTQANTRSPILQSHGAFRSVEQRKDPPNKVDNTRGTFRNTTGFTAGHVSVQSRHLRCEEIRPCYRHHPLMQLFICLDLYSYSPHRHVRHIVASTEHSSAVEAA